MKETAPPLCERSATTTQKLEYDSSLGGPVVLANHVSTYRYAADALKEIKQLLGAVRNPTSTKLIFQTLPKHMRRRGMSHHPKRLPRKYRTAHTAQMLKAGKPRNIQRPSRKHRRRPSNLLRDYLRRQRTHTWLETHIWHARRFHMVNRWGYRLPYASCDKTYRACYRASTSHCLLQDVSFLACLQLQGTLARLAAGFARLTSATCGLGIAAKTFSSGRREGSVHLFRADQYPTGALGRVSFVWRLPKGDTANEQRTLWLWIHPSSYPTILQEVIQVFELKPAKTTRVAQPTEEAESMEEPKAPGDTTPKRQPKMSVKKERQLRFMTRNLGHERIRRYINAPQEIQLVELKDTLNRFRLTGPLAQAILTQALQVAQPDGDATTTDWFQTLLATEPDAASYRRSHEAQQNFWQQCGLLHTPTQLLSNMVLALNIDDPRLHLPAKRTKALPPADDSSADLAGELLLNMPAGLPQSAIWELTLRDAVSRRMASTRQCCELRNKHAIVPGLASAGERAALQPLPVLLVQRPGAQQHPQYSRLGYGCGWDVIAPAGYGMSIWLALIARGARPGGLREFDSVARELGTDQHLPDTVVGAQLAAERYVELHRKYFRMPPNRRVNYTKLAVLSPFRVPFGPLVRDWLPSDHTATAAAGFHILRDRVLLAQLAAYLAQKSHVWPAQLPADSLVQLQVRLQCRGNLDACALICLPTRADFKRHRRQLQREEHAPVYVEPPLGDPRQRERKALRQAHKRLLKRLRGKRVRVKRKLQETSEQRVRIQPAATAALVAAQQAQMCRLWLPAGEADCGTLYTVRKQCTREVFGYISSASFRYTAATVCGVGYATVEGIRQLLELGRANRLKQPVCLVRGTTTRNYRFATIQVNLEV